MPWYKWSRTASSNATADGTINWAEGQAPSSVNDSARAMMAATAMYRDDIAGAIVTTGTSTAYAVTSYSGYDTLAHLDGQLIAFSPHATNTSSCTLNVDSLGSKPIRSAPGVELPSGTLLLGTPYVVLYNNTAGAFYLQGFIGNPYNIPIGSGFDFWGSTAPNSSFAFCDGSQALSRAVYSVLFGLIGTTYGVGDNLTTFNLPDKRGRVSVGEDASAGRISGTNFNFLTRGGVGGAESETLTLSQLPAGINSPVSVVSPGSNFLTAPSTGFGVAAFSANSGSQVWQAFSQGAGLVTANTITSTGTATSNNTGGASHPNVQPSIICKYIMRII